ncbi:MAG: metalloregulator ArsR/SmtB family transcription factor [Dehalococcoidales bacterium]|nr:metalloregulator ArsR/SmtB family transcription factor [Dehalococcoidales bacterium]
MHQFVKALKSLSDDTRLRIVNLLLERECCVCEVMQALEISQTRASRNLTMLYDAGFLKLRKEGPWSLYSLDLEGMPKHLAKLVESVKIALSDNKTAIQDRERLKTTTRTGISCAQNPNGSCSTRLTA